MSSESGEFCSEKFQITTTARPRLSCAKHGAPVQSSLKSGQAQPSQNLSPSVDQQSR